MAAAYRRAIAYLADAGCRYLQLDDVTFAYLCDPRIQQNCRTNGDDPLALRWLPADARLSRKEAEGLGVVSHRLIVRPAPTQLDVDEALLDRGDVQPYRREAARQASSAVGQQELHEVQMGVVFALELGWVSPLSTVRSGMSFFDRLEAIALPIATLTFAVLAHIQRQTRAAVLNVMGSAYIETAELKGIRPIKIIVRHAMPNAVAPIINVVMLNLAYLVVGVVVVEVVFVYPGMGQLMVDHVAKRDVPVVQTCGMIFAATYILLNMTADILSILANPRLRHPK